MDRRVLTAGALIISLILVGGVYITNRSPDVPGSPPETVSPSVEPTSGMEKASLKSFMSMGGTQKCDFTDPDKTNSGTVYINSGKVRGDFASEVNGKTSMTHMINDGQSAYIWMDDQPTGFKTTIEAIEQISGSTGSTQAVDINKQVDYKCGLWSADPDKFTVPADKKFNDMSKMMDEAVKMAPGSSPNSSDISTDDNAQACSDCNSLAGDAQVQCKKILKCN